MALTGALFLIAMLSLSPLQMFAGVAFFAFLSRFIPEGDELLIEAATRANKSINRSVSKQVSSFPSR